MAKYRNNLPQLSEKIFITDGGLETTLIFHEAWELPEFAAFQLMKDPKGYQRLQDYSRQYARIAKNYGTGFILESVTWRANSVWGKKLGYTENELSEANRKAIEMLTEVRDEFETEKMKIVVSGCIGPRGDGYTPTNLMSADKAKAYHSAQIRTFSETAADMVAAFTLNYVEEAVGIVKAAKESKMPVAISFTVETDGKLPTGQTLKDAIETVERETENYPAYYMINCAHPTHFESIPDGGEWTKRIRGLRANSSAKSHEELNDSTEIDEGNPSQLGMQYKELLQKLPNINIFGGCCGTDHRHVEEICKAVI